MKTYRDINGDGGSNVVAQVGEQMARLNARLASVRHIVAVVSGKGGVGKSAVAVGIASALALRGDAVALLDADINGSSLPQMTGVRGETLSRGESGMTPPKSELDIKVVSIDLLMRDDRDPVRWQAPTQKDAYTWRAMMEMGALREFLADTEWGELDFLLLDLPPGTDKLSNVAGLLPRLSGVVIVTIPSRLSQFVVAKSIRAAKELGTPVIGVVENMSHYQCAHCGDKKTLFPGGHVARLAADEDVPFLGGIPFDPRLAAAADEGTLFMTRHADSPVGAALKRIAGDISSFVNGGQP